MSKYSEMQTRATTRFLANTFTVTPKELNNEMDYEIVWSAYKDALGHDRLSEDEFIIVLLSFYQNIVAMRPNGVLENLKFKQKEPEIVIPPRAFALRELDNRLASYCHDTGQTVINIAKFCLYARESITSGGRVPVFRTLTLQQAIEYLDSLENYMRVDDVYVPK